MVCSLMIRGKWYPRYVLNLKNLDFSLNTKMLCFWYKKLIINKDMKKGSLASNLVAIIRCILTSKKKKEAGNNLNFQLSWMV